MSKVEFLAKLDSEGMEYAFTSYGLTEYDLDENDGEFFDLVREVATAYRRADTLSEPLRIMIDETFS